MINFVVGTVFGIVIATVGFTGLASMADKGLQETKTIIQNSAQK